MKMIFSDQYDIFESKWQTRIENGLFDTTLNKNFLWVEISFFDKNEFFKKLGHDADIEKRTIKVYEHFRSLFLIF